MRRLLPLLFCLPLSLSAQQSEIQVSSDEDSVYFTMNGERSSVANKDMAVYYLEEGIAAAVEGNYSSAIDKFRVGLLYDTENADLLYNLGLAQYYLEDYTAAIQTFDLAADVDPQNPEVYNQRGLCKAMLSDYTNAETDFKILLKIAPEHPMGNFNYGVLLLQLGDNEEACRYFKMADSLGYPSAPEIRAQYCVD